MGDSSDLSLKLWSPDQQICTQSATRFVCVGGLSVMLTAGEVFSHETRSCMETFARKSVSEQL